MLYIFSRFGFLGGWLLIALGLVCAASGSLVASLPDDGSIYTSAYDLWYGARPGSLVISQIHVEKIALWLWDPVILGLLLLPGWLLFGGPGIVLSWYFWPGRKFGRSQYQETDDFEPDSQGETEASLHLYETLSANAEETIDNEDDMAPTHQGHQRLAEDAKVPTLSDDQLNTEINKSDALPNS